MSTGDQIVAPGLHEGPERAGPDGQPADTPGRSRRWLWLVPLVLLVVAAIGSAFIRIPYYSLAPGRVVPLSTLVEIEDASTYPPEGELFLTTVSLRRATLLDAIRGWADSAITIRPEDEIVPPDIGREELREFNLELMADSKQMAITVALELLGHDVRSGSGAEILSVVDGSPAATVLTEGDTIVGVDGQPVELSDDAVALLGAHAPGDRVALQVAPPGGGDVRLVEVELAAHPEQAGRPFLGVHLQTRDFALDFPFEVNIDSSRIGGPSAGLAFALIVLDELTPGELTGGRKVAVTGTIAFDGSVGVVGGIAQKTVAVRRSGAELFLVPASEVELARAHAGDDLRVVGVDTIEDALRELADMGGNGLALATADQGPERA